MRRLYPVFILVFPETCTCLWKRRVTRFVWMLNDKILAPLLVTVSGGQVDVTLKFTKEEAIKHSKS